MLPEDPRDRRIAQLEAENAELRALLQKAMEQIAAITQRLNDLEAKNAALVAENAVLRAENTELKAENAELKARFTGNSRNSSRPPSSDPPWEKLRKTRGKKNAPKRLRGGQPGHRGHRREPLPPEQVDCIEHHRPARCPRCGASLSGADPRPRVHQVIDLLDFRPFVTEHRLHALTCAACGATARGTLPPETPKGLLSDRIVALLSLFTGKYKLSKRSARELLQDCFGLTVSAALVTRAEQQTSVALAPPVSAAREHVKAAPIVNADETGWFEGCKRAWLWVAATLNVTVFLIVRSRSAEMAKALLGESFSGFLVSDRYCGYLWVNDERRQFCWAHILRALQGIIDRGGTGARTGKQLLTTAIGCFREWYRVRDGTRSLASFQELVRLPWGYIDSFEDGLRRGALSEDPKVARFCRELLSKKECLWRFVDVPGIEPTNNRAERSLRHAVLWRRSSFGTQSERGSRYVERMLTTVETLRLQKRPVLAFLMDALRAHRLGLAAPSLLPQAADATPAAA